MAKKDTLHPWQQIEAQAFHAFREWPLWLVLRQRDLDQQINPPGGAERIENPRAAAAKPGRH
jgi:hypothetical protein